MGYYSTKSKVKHHREFHGILPRKKLDLICQLCGKKYYHRINLEDHLEEHKVGLGKKLNKCDKCGRAYHYRSRLWRHLKDHDLKSDDTVCSLCGLIAQSKTDMNKHRRKHHNKPPIKNKNKKK